MTTIRKPERFQHILNELDACASVELDCALAQWPALSEASAAQMRTYLRQECTGYGLLTAAARMEAGFHVSTARAIERQGLALAAELEQS
jgi:hypothetical protein